MKPIKRMLKKNASTILTVLGAAGVVATAVTAVQATPKAMRLIEEKKVEKGGELTKWEITQVAAPAYIPSVIICAATVGCILGAHVLNKRTQARLTSAYALLNQTHRTYRKKVKDIYGEDADQKVQEELAKDKYEEDKPEVEDPTQMLFYDIYSKQYFTSTEADVQNAEYLLNRSLNLKGYVTAKEFYDFLRIPSCDSGEELGWSTGMNLEYYWQEWIDFHHQYTIMEDGLECCIIYMMQEPSLGFQEY